MFKNNLYYGLSQELWEHLCDQAEIIFYEEKIGQIILGIYPTGPRMFGLETADPELLCLYLDSGEEILNPLSYINKPTSFPTSHSGSYINFVNLWTWVANLPQMPFEHLAPCFHDSFFQEELIDDIIIKIREFILAFPIVTGYSLNNKTNSPTSRADNALLTRCRFILSEHEIYKPNINPEWDEVFDTEKLTCSHLLKVLDSKVIKTKLLMDYIHERSAQGLEEDYISHLNLLIKKNLEVPYDSIEYIKALQNIGKKTSKFYREVI